MPFILRFAPANNGKFFNTKILHVEPNRCKSLYIGTDQVLNCAELACALRTSSEFKFVASLFRSFFMDLIQSSGNQDDFTFDGFIDLASKGIWRYFDGTSTDNLKKHPSLMTRCLCSYFAFRKHGFFICCLCTESFRDNAARILSSEPENIRNCSNCKIFLPSSNKSLMDRAEHFNQSIIRDIPLPSHTSRTKCLLGSVT